MNPKIIITLGVLVFLIGGTFVAIRWAQGYRFNPYNQVIEGTGLLVANSQPEGASVLINDDLKTATDDTLHLNPGNYKVRLEKDGYTAWEKMLKIENELVTQTNARLFPSVPNFSALTFTGATKPTPSPDGHKIAYQVASDSAQTKNGIWVLNLTDNPLKFGANAVLIALDTEVIKFSQAQIYWVPNSNEILAYFNDNQAYLLNASNENKTTNLVNVAFGLPSMLVDWQQQLALEKQKRLDKLPKQMQEIATTSATLLYFSPNEEKLMYTATDSATIPEKLIPPLPAINFQKQQRHLEPGNVYIYDSKEDTNFVVAKEVFSAEELEVLAQKYILPQPEPVLASPTANTNLNSKELDKPQLDQLATVHAQYSPIYTPLNLQWFSDSYHLIMVKPNNITIMEYDNHNQVKVFSGSFLENFTYPWPNGQKLVLLTSLTTAAEIPANLYALDLE